MTEVTMTLVADAHLTTVTDVNWLRFYIPLDTKYVISETFPKPISWFDMEN